MYTGINHVQLLGRVGVEPKVFGKDGNLVSFPLGTTLRYRANNADGSGTFTCTCICVYMYAVYGGLSLH